MPEFDRRTPITRIAQLELEDERRLVKEGYELLDEKRIRLVAEIRAQLARFKALRTAALEIRNAARGAVRAALDRHGLDDLSVYPPLSATEAPLTFTRSRLFGLELLEARFEDAAAAERVAPVDPSAEARATARIHREALATLVPLAACSVNLRRLLREYQRTNRRARAIENILLPEIETALRFLEDQLESIDQEEIARLKLANARPQGPVQ